MPALHGLAYREDADTIRGYRRAAAKATIGKREFSWFRDRLPDTALDALGWDAFTDHDYDDAELHIGSDPHNRDAPYERVLDALDEAAETAERLDEKRLPAIFEGGPLYRHAYERALEETEQEMGDLESAIDQFSDAHRAWWDVTDAWLEAAADAAEDHYAVNPFEAERREKRVEQLRQYHAATDPDYLDCRYPQHQLGQELAEQRRERDWQMVGAVKGGTLTGVGAMVLGEPLLGAGIGVSGPVLAAVPWVVKTAEQDALATMRAGYRVEEMARRLDDPVLTTVERPTVDA